MTQQMAQMQTLDPVAIRNDAGEARWWFGALAVIKATAADTGGQLSIVEVTEHPGAEAPLHVHHRDDEGFWILEGEVTFEAGDQLIEASAGDYVFGPRDIPHRFTVGPDGARMIWVLTPTGFEDFVDEVSVPAEAATVPPAHVLPPEDAAEIVLRHGMELLPG